MAWCSQWRGLIKPLLIAVMVAVTTLAAGCSASPPWPDVPLPPNVTEVTGSDTDFARRVADGLGQGPQRPGRPPPVRDYDLRVYAYDGDTTRREDFNGFSDHFTNERMFETGWVWSYRGFGDGPQPCRQSTFPKLCVFSKALGVDGRRDHLVLAQVPVRGDSRPAAALIRYTVVE